MTDCEWLLFTYTCTLFSTTYSDTSKLWKRSYKIIYVSTSYIFFHVALPKPKTYFFSLSLSFISSVGSLFPHIVIFVFFYFPTHKTTHRSHLLVYFPFLLLSLAQSHTHVSLSLSPPYFPLIKNSTKFKRFF